MSTLRTRAAKGSELTHAELDANFKRTVSAKTSAYSCLISDNRNWIVGNHATIPFVITLGDAATMAASETGDYEVTIHNVGAAVVTVSRAGTDTIDGAATSITLNQYESVTLKVNATNNGYESIARGLGGLTSTVAELNILDGVTATTSELNYVDGVTSSIQTQIDGTMKIAGAQTITGANTFTAVNTFTNEVIVEGGGPRIKLSDTTAAADNFWVHANSDIFYVLTDRAVPEPLQLNNTTSLANIYGNEVIVSGPAQPIAGVKRFTNTVVVEGDSPSIKLSDTTAGADDFWIHTNSDIFYVLTDRNDDGAWEGSNPLELNNTTAVGSLYGNQIITSASNAVGQSELKTTSGEVSTTVTDNAGQLITLPGGSFGFYPRLRNSNPGYYSYWGSRDGANALTLGTSYVTSIKLYSTGFTAYAQQTYVTASPPYDLGDGEAPFFIFANVDSQGNIVSVYSADTPP